MRIFDPDGPLMTALGKFADIVLCNLMFCLFSLPVFTIGASLTALYTCMQRLVYEEERDDGLIFRTFWQAFRRNFKQATCLWLICLLIVLFLGAYYWIIRSLAAGYARVYAVTFYLLVIVFLFGFVYLFPLQARFENSVKNTLRNAWLLSIAALPWTILCLLVTAALVYVSFFMNPAAVDLFTYLWAVCGFGLVAYLQTFFHRLAFRKLGPEAATPRTSQAAGAVFTDEEHREQDLLVQESSYSAPDWNRRDDILGADKAKNQKRKKR